MAPFSSKKIDKWFIHSPSRSLDPNLPPALSPPLWPWPPARSDPHITTLDGLLYDFQATGEYVFVANPAVSTQACVCECEREE